MKQVSIVMILVVTSCASGCSRNSKAGSLTEYAIGILEGAISSNWDFDQSYVKYLCSKRTKSVLARRSEFAKDWAKMAKYGTLVKIISKDESPGTSDSVQVDVKAEVSGVKRLVIFRFWLKTENGSPCIWGWNFFEEFPK